MKHLFKKIMDLNAIHYIIKSPTSNYIILGGNMNAITVMNLSRNIMFLLLVFLRSLWCICTDVCGMRIKIISGFYKISERRDWDLNPEIR